MGSVDELVERTFQMNKGSLDLCGIWGCLWRGRAGARLKRQAKARS